MKPVAILLDPAVFAIPTYTAHDVFRALDQSNQAHYFVSLSDLASLDRSQTDVLVLPYVDGDMSGPPLAGLKAFHQSGGGLVFLGDTPHVGRSYPMRNSQAPDLRLTRCRDEVKILGLTDMGSSILGDLPDWESMQGRTMKGVRTSAFSPDECHALLHCEAGFKSLSPIVWIDRKHPDFLGARVVVVGFDGGEPRENILGVCERPWSFDPGFLNREWAGADTMVQRLVIAAQPPAIALALEFDPVVPAHSTALANLRVRNLSMEPHAFTIDFSFEDHSLPTINESLLAARSEKILCVGEYPVRIGPQRLQARMPKGYSVSRQSFGFLDSAPDLSIGFSVFRVFRSNFVDEAYRDFLQSTARLGMQYVRMALAWEDIEPEPSNYQWDVPDQLLELAAEIGIPAFFWVFPTARGSGLSEAGVPEWVLKEPSIDRDGKAGNFPCIWSPFYRERYFGFLEAMATRYARDPRLNRFVFDFGNSDFPYTYHFYGDRGDLFDYSPHEQVAFSQWLKARSFPLENLASRWGQPFNSYEEVPVPRSEQTEAWLLYNEFRTWGIHQGIKEAVSIIQRVAPQKVPPDFPGHGIGSIADLITYTHHSQAFHWQEVTTHTKELTDAHNMGHEWGGEPWQVGGRYADYDDALFQSVRLESTYLTIPGPDLGIWEEDLAKVAMIRRTLAGARRTRPRIAIMDKIQWNDWRSLAQFGSRLDQPIDLVTKTCRYDFSCYDIFVTPPDEVIETSRGKESLLPLDEGYYNDILDAVSRGLRVLVFPMTGTGDPLNPLRKVWGLEDIIYGAREARSVEFPESWDGGVGTGFCRTIQGNHQDSVLLTGSHGEILAIERRMGAGGFILVGFDALPDSLDAKLTYNACKNLRDHTLARLLGHFQIDSPFIRTGQINCYKERLEKNGRLYLIFYSHSEEDLPITVEFYSSTPIESAIDLASGHLHEVTKLETTNWFQVTLNLKPRQGYYLAAC